MRITPDTDLDADDLGRDGRGTIASNAAGTGEDPDEIRRRRRTSPTRRDRLQRNAQRMTKTWNLSLGINPDHDTAHINMEASPPRIVISGREFPQPVTDYGPDEWDWLCQRVLNAHESAHDRYTAHGDFVDRLDDVPRPYQQFAKQTWNALEDGAIELQLRMRWPNYSILILHFRANLFAESTPGEPDPNGPGRVLTFAEAVILGCLDHATYDSGMTRSLLDPADTSYYFASDADREQFIAILPDLTDAVTDVLTTSVSELRNKRIFEFIDTVLDVLPDVDNGGMDDVGDDTAPGGMPNDADNNMSDSGDRAKELDDDRDPSSNSAPVPMPSPAPDSEDDDESEDDADEAERGDEEEEGDEDADGDADNEDDTTETDGDGSAEDDDPDEDGENTDASTDSDESEDDADDETDGKADDDGDETAATTESQPTPTADIETDDETQQALADDLKREQEEARKNQQETDREKQELADELNSLADALDSGSDDLASTDLDYIDETRLHANNDVWDDAMQMSKRIKHLLPLDDWKDTNVKRHQRRGRIDGSTVHRVATGSKHVKKQRTRPDDPNINVILVLDRSSSMSGMKIETAETALLAFALALEEHDVNVMVLELYARTVRLACPFMQPLSQRRAALTHGGTSGGTPLADTLILARERLKQERDGLNRMIVVTDGDPNNPGRYTDALKKCSFPVTGVTIRPDGTGDGSGSEYYHRSKQAAPDGTALRRALINLARQLFPKEKPHS